MELTDLPGHISYTLIALSYWATNMLWLRIAAVVGLAMEIMYFYFSGGNLSIGISWNIIFLLINGYQLFKLYQEYRFAKNFASAGELSMAGFGGLSRVQISRIAKSGEWKEFIPGDVLTKEGEVTKHLYYVVRGDYKVERGGKIIAENGPGTFVGEMAYISDQSSSATVTVKTQLRAFVFNTEQLKAMEFKDEDTASALHLMLGRDMVSKLRISRG